MRNLLLAYSIIAVYLQSVAALTFYCINMPNSTARRTRMEHRFSHILTDGTGVVRADVVFVDGVKPTSGLAEYYAGMVVTPSEYDLKNAGCSAAHLKAIRTFLNSDDPAAFICEDDIMFHNDFWATYDDIQHNVPVGTPLITYSYMLAMHEGSVWNGTEPTRHNLRTINWQTWGGQLYYITRSYAMYVLAHFDHRHNVRPLFNELFIQAAGPIGGLIAVPPLAVEEMLDSDRGDLESLPYHHRHFARWGFDNYIGHELNEYISTVVPLT